MLVHPLYLEEQNIYILYLYELEILVFVFVKKNMKKKV